LLQVIVTERSLRTGVNAYIASMAGLDLLASSLLVPLRVVYYLTHHTNTASQHGYALCKAEVLLID
jgi:hypothetical protein